MDVLADLYLSVCLSVYHIYIYLSVYHKYLYVYHMYIFVWLDLSHIFGCPRRISTFYQTFSGNEMFQLSKHFNINCDLKIFLKDLVLDFINSKAHKAHEKSSEQP